MRGYANALLLLVTTLVPLSRAQSTNATLVTSTDGSCGGTTGETCLGSSWGNCCSSKGYCGGTADYCNADCQTDFGLCTANATSISSDARCGSSDPSNQICMGSSFGNCCSKTGYCGSTDAYCGTGCQGDFGECGTAGTNAANNTSVSTTRASSSSLASTATQSTNTASGTASGSSTSGSSSSNTSSTSTASSDAQGQAASESSTSSGLSTGAKAGIAVVVILVILALLGAIFFVLRRRSRRTKNNSPLESDEKAQHASPAPAYASTAEKRDTYPSSKESEAPIPQELDDHREGRAELGSGIAGGSHGHLSELDSKTGETETVELPSSRN